VQPVPKFENLSLDLEVALLSEPIDDLEDALLDRVLVSLDGDLRVVRLLIGSRDAGEVLDLAGTGLFVETLGITLLGDLEGHVDVDLDERQGVVITLGTGLFVKLAGKIAVGPVGGDERGDGDGGRVGKELSNLFGVVVSLS
jgi:hypothetical protein